MKKDTMNYVLPATWVLVSPFVIHHNNSHNMELHTRYIRYPANYIYMYSVCVMALVPAWKTCNNNCNNIILSGQQQ